MKQDELPETVIWWIRRDLRLHDNTALTEALRSGSAVLPVFVRDPHLENGAGERRLAFLHAGLTRLDGDLRQLGSRLIVRRGEPADILAQLVRETGASRVFAEEDFTPYARKRDNLVNQVVHLELCGRSTIHDPRAVAKMDGSPYMVFTPFSRAWKAIPFPRQELTPAPGSLGAVPGLIQSEFIPSRSEDLRFQAGEQTALTRLDAFLREKVFDYDHHRDLLARDGTSNLSPYFHLGMLSARRAAVLAQEACSQVMGEKSGPGVWINELIWRDFYAAVLFFSPRVTHEAFDRGLQNIPWRDDDREIRAWQHGLTGFPVVDAAMRQLMETGWMHNRGRMIVASFLVKDLLVNWQIGEDWFMQQLLDGDLASNNGGWQWTAGVGTDAAPYFRIFNPVLQGKKFDPAGEYVRLWVPELHNVPDRWIHEPWLMPLDVQETAGCRIGSNYPAPIVDHASVRDRTLAAYKLSKTAAAKKSS